MRLSSKIKHVFISKFQISTIGLLNKNVQNLTEQVNESHHLTVLEWAANVVMEVFKRLGNISSSCVHDDGATIHFSFSF